MSIRCKQLTLTFFNGLLVLSGIALIILASLTYNSEFLKDAIKAADTDIDVRKIFAGCVIGFGSGLICLGFLGVIAGFSKNKCLFFIYLFFLFILTILMIGISVAFVYTYKYQDKNYSTKKICDNESDISNFLIEADDAIKIGDQGMCTIGCPCKINPDIQKQFVNYTNFVTNDAGGTSVTTCNPCLSIDPQIIQKLADLRANGTIGPDECPSWVMTDTYFTKREQKTFDLLGWIEKHWDCSGICYDTQFYLFTDINRGPADKTCLTKINDWLHSHLKLGIALGFIVSAILLIMHGLSYNICCEERKRTSSLRNKEEHLRQMERLL